MATKKTQDDTVTTDLHNAATGNAALRESLPSDVELLRAKVAELRDAQTSMQHLEEEAKSAILARIPDYDTLLDRARDVFQEAQETIRQTLLRYFPRGGGYVTFAGVKVGLKKATPKLVVNNKLLTPEWVDTLSGYNVDGRPLIVPTIDVDVLEEAIKRNYVSERELTEAALVERKTPTPSWDLRG